MVDDIFGTCPGNRYQVNDRALDNLSKVRPCALILSFCLRGLPKTFYIDKPHVHLFYKSRKLESDIALRKFDDNSSLVMAMTMTVYYKRDYFANKIEVNGYCMRDYLAAKTKGVIECCMRDYHFVVS